MAGKNVDWNRRAGTLRVDIFKRAKVAYAAIDYLVILYGGFFYLYITSADSSFYGHSHEYDFEKAGYNATGYKKIILKRDKEVIVSTTSKKILTRKQQEKRTRADPLAVGLGDQEIREIAGDWYIEDRDDKLRSLCNTFEAEARKLVATDNSVYEIGSNSSGGYGVCIKMNVKGKPIYKTKIGKTSKRTSLSLSMCGVKSTIVLTIPAEPKNSTIPQPASSQVSLPGMNEPMTLGDDTDVNSPTPNDSTETVATTEELVEIDITSVNDGRNYVTNAEAYAKYGYVERVVDFSEVESEGQLLKLAKIYAKNMQYDEMVLDISALDLHTLNNDIDSLALASDVRCISIPHNLDIYLPVTEISIPLDDPSQVRYTLGSSGVGSMSSSSSNSSKLAGKRLSDRFTKINSDVLELARAHMSAVINQKTTGYVNIIQGENGSEAIVISSEKNWKTSKNLWKFDMNGLAYSSVDTPSEATAANREWKIGMTMEGQIVANFINTGILSDGRTEETAKNWWNLDTGDFRLAAVSALSSEVDNVSGRVNNMETQPYGSDNLLLDSDAEALKKEVAAANRYFSIPKGMSSNYCLITPHTWANKPPISAKNFVQIYLEAKNKYKSYVFYSKYLVDLKHGTQYTVSCWARQATEKGKTCIRFQYGNDKYKSSTDVKLTYSWKLYSYTFTYRTSDTSNSNKAGARIYFSCKVTSDSTTDLGIVDMTGFKLEYGPKATGWCHATDDLIYYAKNQKIDATVYTQNALNKFNQELTQKKIFDKLTKNGQVKTITMTASGNLYINADYINSGYISADLIRTGILTGGNNGKGGNNYWDLRDGKLVAHDIDIYSGSIDHLHSGTLVPPYTNNSPTETSIGKYRAARLIFGGPGHSFGSVVVTNKAYKTRKNARKYCGYMPGHKYARHYNFVGLDWDITAGTKGTPPTVYFGCRNIPIRVKLPTTLDVWSKRSDETSYAYYMKTIKTKPYVKQFVYSMSVGTKGKEKGKLKIQYGAIGVIGGYVYNIKNKYKTASLSGIK